MSAAANGGSAQAVVDMAAAVRAGAQAVRPADRHQPGDRPHAGRHADRGGGRQGADLAGRRQGGRRARMPWRKSPWPSCSRRRPTSRSPTWACRSWAATATRWNSTCSGITAIAARHCRGRFLADSAQPDRRPHGLRCSEFTAPYTSGERRSAGRRRLALNGALTARPRSLAASAYGTSARGQASGVVFMRIVVLGGAGFIGSALCRLVASSAAPPCSTSTSSTPASSLASLAPIALSPRYAFRKADGLRPRADRGAAASLRPDAIVHAGGRAHGRRRARATLPRRGEANVGGIWRCSEAAHATGRASARRRRALPFRQRFARHESAGIAQRCRPRARRVGDDWHELMACPRSSQGSRHVRARTSFRMRTCQRRPSPPCDEPAPAGRARRAHVTGSTLRTMPRRRGDARKGRRRARHMPLAARG